jgi:sugar transferase (PEP-CTERM/EpsH1 system associated)
MRILWITLGLPFPPDSGTRIRDFNLIRQVSTKVEICLCSLLTEDLPPEWRALQQYCETIETYRPSAPASAWSSWVQGSGSSRPLATRPFYFESFDKKIREILDSQRIDVVQIEHSFLACYRQAIPAASKAKTILSFHNVGSLQYRRIASLNTGLRAKLGFMAKAILMQGWEARIAARFDRSIVVSRKEGRLLHNEDHSLRLSIIENGVDCDLFKPLPESASDPSILFLGVLSYPPNTDAVQWFVREAWPSILSRIPGAQLHVAGHSPPPALQHLHGKNGVSIHGYVEDPQTLYSRATLVIAPLRAGGGTRLKILEAMALGRPVVSTSIGCEGLEVISGEHLIVANGAHDFASAVIQALSSSDLRQRIATNARNLVETRYSWRGIGHKLVDVYQETCDGAALCK